MTDSDDDSLPDETIPDEKTLHRVEYTHGPEKADDEEMTLLHLSFLFDKKSRVHIIDWLLTDAPEGQYLSKSEIARRADVGRNSVTRHIDVLVDFGLVNVQGENSPRYAPAVESDSFLMLRQTNLVLERVYRTRAMARSE